MRKCANVESGPQVVRDGAGSAAEFLQQGGWPRLPGRVRKRKWVNCSVLPYLLRLRPFKLLGVPFLGMLRTGVVGSVIALISCDLSYDKAFIVFVVPYHHWWAMGHLMVCSTHAQMHYKDVPPPGLSWCIG